MIRTVLVAASICAFVAPAFAQGADEIVVTASKRLEAFESLQVPHVVLKRRADFVIVELEVRSDTRDLSQRREEIRQALRGLQTRAGTGAITLALTDDDAGLVREFSLGAAEELIRADRRPDTSLLTIRLRTPVSPQDTLESINARIERFVAASPKTGRVEMETGEAELTLVNPEQYREPMLREIAADGRRIAEMLGAGYGVTIEGLERQVAWRRSADLEMTLFIPYGLGATPQAR